MAWWSKKEEPEIQPSKKLLRITFKAGVSAEEFGGAKKTQDYKDGVEYIVPTVGNDLEISNLGAFLNASQRQEMFGTAKKNRIEKLNIPNDVVINIEPRAK